MRVGLIFLMAASLAAGEGEPPLMSFKSGGMSMSLAADRPSEAVSGVWIRYEAVRLECDRLTYRMAAIAGTKQPVLASADLFGGPAGPSDGRVLFDSSGSRLPQMAFRGVLHPRSLAIRRLESDPEHPEVVRFRAEASDLGDVVGVVDTPAGPRQHLAWADRAVLEFTGVVDAKAAMGLGMPRMTALHFYGRPAAEGVAARPAIVLRLGKPVALEDATVEKVLAAGTFGMRASGMTMSLFFDPQGALSGYQSDTGDYEMRDGEDLVPRLGSSRPKLNP